MKSFIVIAVLIAFVNAGITFYSFDGSGNNEANPTWGQINIPLKRLVAPEWGDGISEPRGGLTSTLPSPRAISNTIFNRVKYGSRDYNPRPVTDILTYWGQFIDHEFDLSPDGDAAWPIPIPTGDEHFDPNSDGGHTMLYTRTKWTAGTGTDANNPRIIPNVLSAWIDGGVVYGDDLNVANGLKDAATGLLRTQMITTLPAGDQEFPLRMSALTGVRAANPPGIVPTSTLFGCGDRRCNENPILLSLHILFVREHNRRVRAMTTGTATEKFDAARKMVIGHLQAITVNEYLPTLVNEPNPLGVYAGYNSSADPAVSAFFNTVSFRYGHDEINALLLRHERDGFTHQKGNIMLRNAYFNPDATTEIGLAPYFRGASVNRQHAVDAMMIQDLRDYLFGLSAEKGTDLAARNIHRARDHAIPDLNKYKQHFGLNPCTDFTCVAGGDATLGAALSTLYGGDLTKVDAFGPGLLEAKKVKAAGNSNLGPLFEASIIDQIKRIRDGDRFWFEKTDGPYTAAERMELQTTKLSDIIIRNTSINQGEIPADTFILNTNGFCPAIGQ